MSRALVVLLSHYERDVFLNLYSVAQNILVVAVAFHLYGEDLPAASGVRRATCDVRRATCALCSAL